MSTTAVPLSDLARRTTEVTTLVADGDVTLTRRDAADLYLSTVERHEQERQAASLSTAALATLARVRPDLAGEVLAENLPWMAWLPAGEKIACFTELLADLRAGVATGQLRPFSLSLAAWESTAISWGDPQVSTAFERPDESEWAGGDEAVVARPSA